MEPYNIVNIQEIAAFRKSESYKGEIAVFTSDIGTKFLLFENKSVYLNAFSYILCILFLKMDREYINIIIEGYAIRIK